MSGKIVLTIVIYFVIFLFSPKNVFGQESQFGYRVTQAGKTVIQIARDVYNDERQWKKIAYWNNLTPPYALSIGQVLVLPMQPKRPLSEKNLVTGAEVPAPQFLQQLPSVSRVIWNRKGYYVYEVNERAPSLSMVALENYGDKNMVKLIARWNGLATNEHLSLGQKLIFHEKPTLTGTQSNTVLVKEWARVGNEVMVQRLAGKTLAPTFETAKPTQAPATVVEKFQAKPKAQPETMNQPAPASAETVPTTPSIPVVETAPTFHPTPTVETQSAVEPAPAKAGAPPASAATPTAAEVPAKINTPSFNTETGAVPPVEATKQPETEKTRSTSSIATPTVSVPAVHAIAVPSLPSVPSASMPSLPTSSASKASTTEPVEESVVHGSKKLPEKKVQSVVTEPVNLGQPINMMETPTPNVFNPSDDPELQTTHQTSGTSVPVAPPVQAVQPIQEAPTKIPEQPSSPQTVQQTIQQPSQPVTTPAAAPTSPPVQAAQPEESERKPSSTPTDPLQMPEPATESYWLGSDTTRIMKMLTKPNGK